MPMPDITLPSGVTLRWLRKDEYGGNVYESNLWAVADIRLDEEKHRLLAKRVDKAARS